MAAGVHRPIDWAWRPRGDGAAGEPAPEGDLMAECPSCNAPLKDGDWTCGACGAPVAGAGMARGSRRRRLRRDATAYTARGRAGLRSAAGLRRPGRVGAGASAAARGRGRAPARAGSSGLLKLVLVVGVVAVLAIILVWFFVLRGPTTTGEEFLGAWTATTQQGIATITVTPDGGRVRRRDHGERQEPEGHRAGSPGRRRPGHHHGRLLTDGRRGERGGVQDDPQGARRRLQDGLQQRGCDPSRPAHRGHGSRRGRTSTRPSR